MGNDALRDLIGQMRSGRLSRRQFMTRAAAMGLSATAISGALRQVPTRAQETTTVTFWSKFTPPAIDWVKQQVDAYNAQATGHQVELTQIPPSEVDDDAKLMAAVRGGSGPDVYLLDRFIVAQRAGDGLLQDLSAMGADEVITQHIAFARAEASFDGKVYALPFDTDVRALYYNKAMIQAAGTDPAEFDAANGPLTWDRVKEVANTLNVQDSNGNYTQMGFVPWVSQGWHYTYGFSWGATFFDSASCQVTPDEPAVVAASTWVQNYCKELGADKVNAFGNPSMQPAFDQTQHPFLIGTVAMHITGDWEIARLEQLAPTIDYGITWMPVPKTGDQSATWAGGWSVVIPQGAKNVEEAWTFMQWIAGEPGQRMYTEVSSHMPTIEALQTDAELFDERHRFFAEQLMPTAHNRPPLPVGAKYWNELTVAWQKIYLDQATPEQALKDAKDHVQPDLQRFCPITIS
jgi:ABC-type glycerol-3-phosphate transport system substrate-binding protein